MLPDPWYCKICKPKKDRGGLTPFEEQAAAEARLAGGGKRTGADAETPADVKVEPEMPAPKKKVYVEGMVVIPKKEASLIPKKDASAMGGVVTKPHTSKILISNLGAEQTSERELADIFAKYGTLACRPELRRNSAVVSFADSKSATKAINCEQGTIIGGLAIHIKRFDAASPAERAGKEPAPGIPRKQPGAGGGGGVGGQQRDRNVGIPRKVPGGGGGGGWGGGGGGERRRAEEGLKRKLSGVQSLWYNVTVRDIVQGFAEMKQLRSADYASKMSELERKNQTASMRLQGMLDEVHARA